MIAAPLALLALLQGGPWSTWPPSPTVGDTIWLERVVPTPTGWRVRPGRLASTDDVEPLIDPATLRHQSGWVVRYAFVVWTTGPVRVAVPPVWRLGPGGEADSLPAGTAVVTVRSVIPDSVVQPTPRPALAPLWPDVRRPAGPMVAGGVALAALVAAIAWRRRPPRTLVQPAAAPPDGPADDERWMRAGEPRAVAARAVAGLRAALARAVPEAHPALSTFEALAIAARALPDHAQRELATLLTALDQVGFAAVHGAAVRDLAAQARALGRKLAP